VGAAGLVEGGGMRDFLSRGEEGGVNGEDAKRLLAYSPNTPRDVKV